MLYHLTIDASISRWEYSKQFVRSVLAGYKGKHVDVKITSLGGDLDHGLDIRQQFIDHGDVTAYLSGFVASAATVIAMGAKHIVMSKYAMFLVHKCSNFLDVWGSYNADQMQQLINDLEANKKENDKIDVVLANMYAAKCKKKVSDILEVLKAGRWMTAQEALEWGFIDEIAETDGEQDKLNFTPEMDAKFNALGITTYGIAQRQHNKHKQMKTYKFNAAESVMGVSGITPDADGYVSVTAGQFEQISNEIASLQSKAASIAEKDKKIAELEEQVENLKKAPGDETSDVHDNAADEPSFTADEMFNSIKNSI